MTLERKLYNQFVSESAKHESKLNEEDIDKNIRYIIERLKQDQRVKKILINSCKITAVIDCDNTPDVASIQDLNLDIDEKIEELDINDCLDFSVYVPEEWG